MITFLDFHLSYFRSSSLLATKDSYKNGGIPVNKNSEYKLKQMQIFRHSQLNEILS